MMSKETGRLARWSTILLGLAGCTAAPAASPTSTVTLVPAPTVAPPPSTLASADAAPALSPERVPVRPTDTKGMVLLPGGTYITMAYRRNVTLAPFWLDVTEVTAGAYRACVVAGKCTDEGLACDEIHPVDTYRRPGKENHPINCVNQVQAMAYCAFVGKRLPTADEWEWAARGTTRGSTYPWGEAPPDKQLCWKRCNDNAPYRCRGTCRVHSLPWGDSPQGIADLAGNVSEWTTSSMPGRVSVHGGDWMETNPVAAKAGVSDATSSTYHAPGNGFRCAGDGPAASP